MKLVEIHFDWNPSIPGADARGEGLLFPLKTQSIFRAEEGWSIEKLAGGEFRLHREGMPAPVVVGDGYTYVEAEPVRIPAQSDPDEMAMMAMQSGQNASVAQAQARARRKK